MPHNLQDERTIAQQEDYSQDLLNEAEILIEYVKGILKEKNDSLKSLKRTTEKIKEKYRSFHMIDESFMGTIEKKIQETNDYLNLLFVIEKAMRMGKSITIEVKNLSPSEKIQRSNQFTSISTIKDEIEDLSFSIRKISKDLYDVYDSLGSYFYKSKIESLGAAKNEITQKYLYTDTPLGSFLKNLKIYEENIEKKKENLKETEENEITKIIENKESRPVIKAIEKWHKLTKNIEGLYIKKYEYINKTILSLNGEDRKVGKDIQIIEGQMDFLKKRIEKNLPYPTDAVQTNEAEMEDDAIQTLMSNEEYMSNTFSTNSDDEKYPLPTYEELYGRRLREDASSLIERGENRNNNTSPQRPTPIIQRGESRVRRGNNLVTRL